MYWVPSAKLHVTTR